MNLSPGATMAFLAACILATPKNDTLKNKAVSSTPPPEPFSIVSMNLDPDMTLHQPQHGLSENGYRLRAESPTYGDSLILGQPPKPSAAAVGVELSKADRAKPQLQNTNAIKTSSHKLAYNSWDKQCVAVWFNPKCISYQATFDKNGCKVFGINLVSSLAQQKTQMGKCKDINKD